MKAITLIATFACSVYAVSETTGFPSLFSESEPKPVSRAEADAAYKAAHEEYTKSRSIGRSLMEKLKGAVTSLKKQAETEHEREIKAISLLEKNTAESNKKMEQEERVYEDKINAIVKTPLSLLEAKPVKHFDQSNLKEWREKLRTAMDKLQSFMASSRKTIKPSFVEVAKETAPFDLEAEKDHLRDTDHDLQAATVKLVEASEKPVIPSVSLAEENTSISEIQSRVAQLTQKLNADILRTQEHAKRVPSKI